MERRTPSSSRSCAGKGKSRCTRSTNARTAGWRGCGTGAGTKASAGVSPSSPACARANAEPKAFKLGFKPTPPRSMVDSNCVRLNGSTPDPANAPKSTALITLPEASAACAMSKRMKRLAALLVCASSCALSTRPSPSALFSAIEYTRCVDAMSVVRSLVTRPRCTARPASISSDASTTSTSPGNGISASTGRPPSASACAVGYSST